MNVGKWIKFNTLSLKGKTVAISGATGGIGQKLCRHLAGLGADLILLDRNTQKSHALGESLKAEFSHIHVLYITLNLENTLCVKAVAEELKEIEPDYLILNAGAYHIPRHSCDTGLNNVFQINFASPYYLARTLMPYIKKRGGRIIAVGSIAHNYSHIDLTDIDFSAYKSSAKVYGNAKRYLMYSLYSLFDNTDLLSVVHPGITLTNITAHYPKPIFAVIKHPMKIIFMKPQKACLSILYGIFKSTRKNEWIGPRYFNVWGFPKLQNLNTCSNDEAEQISAIAEKVYQKMCDIN